MPKPNMREQLLTAAVATLHGKGFNGCSVEDITQAAGVPKGSFYNHFDSKEALGVAALERYAEMRGRLLDQHLRDETYYPLERLRNYFATLCKEFAEQDFRGGCMVGNFSLELSDQDPAMRHSLSKVFADWARRIEICIKAAQTASQISPASDAGSVAQFLINALEGAFLRAKAEKNGAALAGFMDIVFAKILC